MASLGNTGCTLSLTNSTITTGNGFGVGVFLFASAPHPNPNFITFTNVDITVGNNYLVIGMEDSNAESRMVLNEVRIIAGASSTGVRGDFEGANITLNSSEVTVGAGGTGLMNLITKNFATKIFTNNTPVTVGNNGVGADFFGGGFLSMNGGSLSVGAGGIGVDVTAGKPLTEFRTSSATFDGTTVTSGGTGINVEGSDALITFKNSASIVPGNGLLLSVKGTDFGPPDGFQPSAVTLTADTNAKLTGDIVTADRSTANVALEHSSTLTRAINKNNLTGASGPDPAQPIPASLIEKVNLSGDSTSTWNLTGSSTVSTLLVNNRDQINFPRPTNPTDFHTLVVTDLEGEGGAMFGMNVDLRGLGRGDLLTILRSSEHGEIHLLEFRNPDKSHDLDEHIGLLVVQAPDTSARFSGEVEGGTFHHFVVHGETGNPTAPVETNWYLVRGDEITKGEVKPLPPPTHPPPPPPLLPGQPPRPPDVAPGDNNPDPPPVVIPPVNESRADALTNTANAAIGTYSAVLPMFYADLGTLEIRLGELRPLSLAERDRGAAGKEIAPPLPPPGPLGLAFWIRGFGSGSHINNQVSRAFDQSLGGFQVGADKRLPTRWGDLYLGGFLGYFYASRDFLDNSGDGYTNAFSLGAYTTLIHPSGFYVDLVIKNTWLWNHFSVSVNPSSSADYSDETFGGSIEIGKRWDIGKFFVEPQRQLAGAWADSQSYNASNGLRVNASSQGSLRGRLGLRTGLHLECGHMVFEPFAGVFCINEFLGGDRVTTNQTPFFPTLSGPAVDVTAGVNARITDSIYMYGQYEYESADKFRIPWTVDVGLRWQW